MLKFISRLSARFRKPSQFRVSRQELDAVQRARASRLLRIEDTAGNVRGYVRQDIIDALVVAGAAVRERIAYAPNKVRIARMVAPANVKLTMSQSGVESSIGGIHLARNDVVYA